jgi:iron complex transport system permease protein
MKTSALYGLYALLIVVTLGVGVFVGSSGFINPFSVGSSEGFYRVLFELRIPRVLAAFMLGGSLSLAGLLFQILFRNELATPCTLGVSGGASLGVAVWALLSALGFVSGASYTGMWGGILAAFCGASISIALVVMLARIVGGVATVTLLLAGVVVNATLAALMQCMIVLSSPNEVFSLSRWASGSLSQMGYEKCLAFFPAYAVQLAIMVMVLPEITVLLIGSDQAVSRGVSVERVQKQVLTSSALCVGTGLALFGPITFLGIIVPFIGRLLVGMRLSQLMSFSLIGGGCFLVWIDTLARTVVAPLEVPVGIFTALLGGPFFLYLLIKRGSSRY